MTVEETRYLFLINNTIGEGDIYVIISVCLSTHVHPGFNETIQEVLLSNLRPSGFCILELV